MNQVHLSGIVAEQPLLNAGENIVSHLTFPLCVTHRTAKNEVKRELYGISAWNGTAEWARAHLRQGDTVAIRGYLSQKYRVASGLPVVSVEVTATEFFPLRRETTILPEPPADREEVVAEGGTE